MANSTNIYEKTMQACLESKRLDNKKKIESSKKPSTLDKKKRINESIAKTKTKKIQESYDIEDPENEYDMPDISDDIVVVTDPELDPEDARSEMQDIVDNTPAGEVPSTDEYVDDLTYSCPICGSNFFSESEMTNGMECPVCGETPSGYVLIGGVKSPDEALGDTDEGEDLEPDMESAKRESKKSTPMAKKRIKKESTKSRYNIDESTFNPFLNRFIRENYRNANKLEIKAAKLRGTKLSLECMLTMKSGKSKKVILAIENFKPSANMVLTATDSLNIFKMESKTQRAPFIFKANMDKSGVIRCEGLKYNFITKAIKEGKRVQVFGNLIRESKKAPKNKKRV